MVSNQNTVIKIVVGLLQDKENNMAGFLGAASDVTSELIESGIKGTVKAGAKGAGAVTKMQKGLYQKVLDMADNKILDGTDNMLDRALSKNLGETVNTLGKRETQLAEIAENGIVGKTGSGAGNTVEDIVDEGVKAAKAGGGANVPGGPGGGGPGKGGGTRKRNALIGSAVGGVAGAGIGGITGMVTGADEDNQNGMIVTGALAGIAGGAMVGGLFGNNITKVAGGIAKGASNEAVEGGAKGLLKNAGASAQNFADKIDDIGTNVYKKTTKQSRLELAKQIKKNSNLTSKEALRMANKAASSSADELEKGIVMTLDDGSIGRLKGMEPKDIESLTKSIHTGNTLGGAAQGAIMGAAGGALVGGVAGGIDEDDTFIGGALKGGLIGGTLGGIGGGVSGYFNNSAKILSNTTANVNSLLGK